MHRTGTAGNNRSGEERENDRVGVFTAAGMGEDERKMREMKYISTYCSLCGEICNIVAEKLNDKHNHHSQFRIVCKARGIKHANELTSWATHNAFRRDYCAETGNETELSFFEKDSNVNFIIGSSSGIYITDIELKALLQTHPTQKGDWVGENERE